MKTAASNWMLKGMADFQPCLEQPRLAALDEFSHGCKEKQADNDRQDEKETEAKEQPQIAVLVRLLEAREPRPRGLRRSRNGTNHPLRTGGGTLRRRNWRCIQLADNHLPAMGASVAHASILLGFSKEGLLATVTYHFELHLGGKGKENNQ